MKTIKLFINAANDISKEWCWVREKDGSFNDYWRRDKLIGPAVYFSDGDIEYHDAELDD